MTSLLKVQFNRNCARIGDYSANFGCLARVVLLNLIKR